MAARIAAHHGLHVFGVDLVPERLDRLRRRGIDVIDASAGDRVAEAIRQQTDGRGPDAVIDAVGMEAHGAPAAKAAQKLIGLLPEAAAQQVMSKAGTDRLAALHLAIDIVRRGGTISVIGVYGGIADPLPLLTLFDKQIQLRMGQANVRRWTDQILPLLTADADQLGVDDFATHRLPLAEGPHAYDIFQRKTDGAVKILLQP